ncbi:MAG: crossover junction endodeoxyribonuclease RuvC [Chloroflexota bacterium]|nr:crossover junction endodeoxyribonuclease RuvC [Chloroflexota bacterium]MDE3102534.1 crossover junction endodeoxyribonuclease RuvC [Chloroflexota bacterium]
MTPGGVILGIDPGTTGMGYALLDRRTEPPSVLDRGIIPTPQAGSPAERLAAIADAIDALIVAHDAAALALERLYFNRNVRTAMAVAEARGIALLCAARRGLEVAEYTPQEVKISVAGTGSADKKQVMKMLAIVLALPRPISEDNVADAVAIALTHAQRSRFAAAVAKAAPTA